MTTETLTARLARQMAENYPGTAVRVGNSTSAAIGEREKADA